ncbi:hypothetical protein KEJ15_09695, partial [Candidatus Bathyarchaeota archaeon]|nr:hypothetical protein [Candidatus Bathyarchaeota archaeon]
REHFDQYEQETRGHLIRQQAESEVTLTAFIQGDKPTFPTKDLNMPSGMLLRSNSVFPLLLTPEIQEDKKTGDTERLFIKLVGVLHILTIFPKLTPSEQTEAIRFIEREVQGKVLERLVGTLVKFVPMFWTIVDYLNREKAVTISQIKKYLEIKGLSVSPKSLRKPEGWIYREVLAPLQKTGCIIIKEERNKTLVIVNEKVWSTILGSFLEASRK